MKVSSRVFLARSIRFIAFEVPYLPIGGTGGAMKNLRRAIGIDVQLEGGCAFGQSVPSLCGLRGSPSMLTIFPSMVWTRVPQPTEQ